MINPRMGAGVHELSGRGWNRWAVALVGGMLLADAALAQSAAPQPTELPGLSYDVPFFPGAKYNPAVPTPDSILGFPVGQKAATPAQIEAVITALATKNPRVQLFTYATSYEGRRLHYLVISSEDNIRRLDQIQADLAKLADPRAVPTEQADRLADTLPAVAWMAYAIHGDEMSGADAALAVAYHLAASTDEPVRKMLEELVVIIDPLMNPDGRERCLRSILENRTAQPNIDDQSVMHTQVWPSGRMNHYLFDMNRDWPYGTQPETRGRIQAVSRWHPQFFLESHEMWPQATFLFLPAREPVNPNMPASVRKWMRVFAEDHAAAFDRLGWRYYTGEWNEEWYPGYSSTWAAMRGAIGQLYEQAEVMADGVRRRTGAILTYREAVHHQLVSSMANLTSLQANRQKVMRDYLADRRQNISADSPNARRTFAVRPTANAGRLRQFTDLMSLQGFELYVAGKDFDAAGRDRLGRGFLARKFPAGTILIPNCQPEAALLSCLMEFDPRLSPEFLTEERRELLRFGASRLYDVTAWNISMMFDVDCCELAIPLPKEAAKYAPASQPTTTAPATDGWVALVIDGADDRSVAAAGRLMEREVRVRVADKAFQFDGREYARGSVAVVRKDNADFAGDLAATVSSTAAELGLAAIGVRSGMGPGDLPDLGSDHFDLLEQPRIAVVGREPFDPCSYGEVWYLVDHLLGLRATYLDAPSSGWADLRRYNVIVLPNGGGAAVRERVGALRPWVEGGGTLIAIGSSAAELAKEAGGIGSTRLLPDVLDKLDEYHLAVVREWQGREAAVDPAAVWSNVPPAEVVYPWSWGGEKLAADEARRRDSWRSIFMPRGAILAARVDDRSWLTAGCGDYLPVFYDDSAVLLASGVGQVPLRLGVIVPEPVPQSPERPASQATSSTTTDGAAAASGPADAASGTESAAAVAASQAQAALSGWRMVPPGYELRLRMSGLLWPEAADRVAHSAYVTCERIGSGQVILFASSPTFRGATLGTMRVLSNALICGPGMGASQPIRP